MVSKRTAYLPAVIDGNKWGAIFTDAVLWQPVVRRICQEMGLAPALSIKSGYPGSCAVFIVDREIVLKLYPPLFAADFERELIVYEAIQDRLAHIPRVLAHGVYADRMDWPYVILSFCPGVPIREIDHHLSRANKESIGLDLGRLIRDLHHSPLPERLATSWQHWRDFLLENRGRTLRHLRQERPFSGQVIDEIELVLSDTEGEWLVEQPLCLINADLTQDHLLLVQEKWGWKISAVIDWADAEVGVPAYEWIPLWYGLCQRDELLFQHILAAYDPLLNLDESLSRELLTYTFLHRFGGEIIVQELKQLGKPAVRNLAELQTLFCPQTQS